MRHRVERWLCVTRSWRIIGGGILILSSSLLSADMAYWFLSKERSIPPSFSPLSNGVKIKLLQLPARHTLAQQRDRTPPPLFSTLTFCQQNAATFISWQPRSHGGELVMEILWDSVPVLFSQLANYDLRIARFILELGSAQLRLTLHLEQSDAA